MSYNINCKIIAGQRLYSNTFGICEVVEIDHNRSACYAKMIFNGGVFLQKIGGKFELIPEVWVILPGQEIPDNSL